MTKDRSISQKVARHRQRMKEDAGILVPNSNRMFADALRLAVMRVKGDRVQLARIADALVRRACRGDVAAIREVADRLDGKVATNVNLGDSNGNPLATGIAVVFVGGEAGNDSTVIEGVADADDDDR